MSETINIPKVGPVKRTYVIGGVAVVGAYVVYRYWSAAQGSSAPMDPGEYQPDTSSVTQSGGAPLAGERTGNTTDTTGTDGAILTNSQWTDVATEKLELRGFDGRTILTALGKYLARKPLTDAEAQIVQAARAAAGDPPVGGPYPIQLVTGGNTTPVKPTVPGTVGSLGMGVVHGDNAVATWAPVSGATGYTIDWSPGGSRTLSNVNAFRITGLTPGRRYTVRVRARNKTGLGPWSKTITFTTGKRGS